MSTVTIAETSIEEEQVSEQSPDSQTLDEQQALYTVYDRDGTPYVVDAQGFEVVDVASTNLQGNLQQTGGCLLEGNVTSMRPEGNLTHLGEAQHYVQTMQYHQHASGDASDLDQRLQQPMQNVTSSNANVFIADSQVP